MKCFLKKSIFLIILLFVIYGNGYSQNFKASGVFGINLSQIDGDDLYGYSKLGWTGGAKLGYPIAKKSDISLEMLYSQRGSTSGFGFGSLSENFADLKYIEFPLYVNYNDWFIEKEKYFKVSAHAGLSYARLFSIRTSGNFSTDIDDYNSSSLSYLFGFSYAFTKRIALTIRYTRAVHSLYTSESKISKAIGYYITFRAEYSF